MSMTEASAFKWLGSRGNTASKPLPTENDGYTRQLHGVEAMDDCSVTALVVGGAAVRFVQTVDYIRGEGFELYQEGYLGRYNLGWYLAGANLSDIAAMGAQPVNLHAIVRYGAGFRENDFAQLMGGFEDCIAAYGCGAELAGGDTGGGGPSLGAAAMGVSHHGLLMQSGARPGHDVYVTGPTGLAGAARIAKQDIGREPYTESLIEKWRRVHPRVAEGLAVTAAVHDSGAGTDTSDGLRAALDNIARKSKVGVAIDKGAIPIHPSVEQAARRFGRKTMEVVFGNSVDFELVFTADVSLRDALEESFSNSHLPQPFRIGQVVDRDDAPDGASRAYFNSGELLPGEVETHAA